MTSRDKRDVYYRLAKEHNLRARSAFKLLQIEKHLNIFDGVKSVVDLCAAPGGWSVLSTKIIKERHKHSSVPPDMNVVAVDVVPIHALEDVQTIVGDITHPTTANHIIAAAKGRADLVLFDGAPEVTGLVENDQWQQHMLVEAGAQLCIHILRPGGTYVAKVFRGSATQTLLDNLSVLFHQVLVTKPQASRNSSLEVFVTCRGLRDTPILKAIPLDTAFALGLTACAQYQLQADAVTRVNSVALDGEARPRAVGSDGGGGRGDGGGEAIADDIPINNTTVATGDTAASAVGVDGSVGVGVGIDDAGTAPSNFPSEDPCLCSSCSGYPPSLRHLRTADPTGLVRAIRDAYGDIHPCMQRSHQKEDGKAAVTDSGAVTPSTAVTSSIPTIFPRYYPFYLCSDLYDSDMSYSMDCPLPYDVFDYLSTNKPTPH